MTRRGPQRSSERWAIIASVVAVLAIVAGALVAPRGVAKGGGRSLLYPRPPAVLRFSHSAAHLKKPCASCHRGVARSISANDRHVPREDACRGCHPKQTRAHELVALPASAEAAKPCATCHTGYRGGAAPARLRLPAARIRFSHRIHGAKGIACASCHVMRGGQPSMPSMASCIGCHKLRGATERCSACHLTRKDGKLKVRFGVKKLRPKGSLIGAAHTPGFKRKGHGRLARQQPKNCKSCHQRKQCLRCHAGSFKPLRIHRSDYASHHAMDARLNNPRCQSCHRSQTFCRSCHLRSGVSPGSRRGGFRPNTGRSFHPKGFVSRTVGPKHHSHAARRNMRSCSSCHSEKSCIRCHGTRGRKKGGFSPHGKGFAGSAKCRALKRRNPRVCTKCHRRGDAALSRCR